MASLRSPLAKGFRAALGGASDDVGTILADRKKLAETKRQEQVAMERMMLQMQMQHDLQQDALAQAEERTRRVSNAAGMQGLFGEVAEPGKDPAALPSAESLLQRAQGFGQRDSAYPGAGAQINLPGRGMTTVTAHPIRPTSERTPIEELLRAGEAARTQAGQAQATERRLADGKIQRYNPTEGAMGVLDSNGNFVRQERNALEAGEHQGTTDAVANALTLPGEIEKLRRELPIRAQYQPQLLTGLGLGGQPQFSTLTPGQHVATPVEGITPRPTGTGTGATGNSAGSRLTSARSQLANFIKLSEKVNTEDGPGQILAGGVARLQGALRMNPEAEEYGKVKGALASTLTAVVSGAQASNAERETFENVVGGWTTTKSVSKKLNRLLAEMVGMADTTNGRPISNLTPEQLQAEIAAGRVRPTMTVQQMVEFINRGMAAGTPPEAGNQPGANDIVDDFDAIMGGQ